MKSLSWKINFYRETIFFKIIIFFRKKEIKKYVVKTKKIEIESVKDTDNVVFISLFCHKDVYEGIVAFKSLYQFLDVKFPLIILDDGSLTDLDEILIVDHIKNVKIIRRKQADIEVNNFLKENGLKNCLDMRRDFLVSIKIFDAYFYSKGKKIIIIDTDILFYKKPDVLIDLINQDKSTFIPFYNKDLHSVYSYKIPDLKKFANMDIQLAVNSGLIGFFPSMDIITMTEKFLAQKLPFESPWLVEQTMYAMYFSLLDANPLPEDYDVMARYARKGFPVICQHYAGFSRPHFYRQYLETIHSELI